ncbi:MAG: hypothetical protein KUG81_03085 [Gammaproteobacteria bacterium]|nr:hypothetical protein [Gammaproteobacteria bacterium]
MPFEKGQEKKGGRKKGTTNKATTVIRDAFANLLKDNLEQLKLDFEELDAKDRIKLALDMSKYIVPTLKATDVTSGGEPIQTLFDIKELYGKDKEA